MKRLLSYLAIAAFAATFSACATQAGMQPAPPSVTDDRLDARTAPTSPSNDDMLDEEAGGESRSRKRTQEEQEDVFE